MDLKYYSTGLRTQIALVSFVISRYNHRTSSIDQDASIDSSICCRTRNVHDITLIHRSRTSNVCHLCVICVSSMCHLCVICVSSVSYVYNPCAICVPPVCHLYVICVPSVRHLCAICVPSVCHLYAICVSSVCHLCAICVPSVCHLCVICVPSVCHLPPGNGIHSVKARQQERQTL